MPYTKKTLIVIVTELEDGFDARYFKWDQAPPPTNISIENALTRTDPEPVVQFRQSADSAALKTEFGAVFDAVMA